MQSNHRNAVIDAWRGLAVLGVMAFHYTIACTPPHDANLCHYAGRYDPIFGLGNYGPELFFVISGLVIAMTVSRVESAAEFVTRRFARLWPAFLVACTMTFLLMRAFGPTAFQVSARDYLANWTMVAPKFGSPFVDGVYWSLGPELKFYVWTAAAFLVLRQRFWIGITAVGWAGAVARVLKPGLADAVFGIDQTPLFLVGIGAYFAILDRKWIPAWTCGASGLLLGALTLPGAFHAQGLPDWAPLAVMVAAPAVMFALLVSGKRPPLGPLPWIGRISYSLYLVHNRIGVTLIAHLRDWGLPDYAAMAIGALFSIGLACALFQLVEQPGQAAVMAMWRKLRPSGARPVREAPIQPIASPNQSSAPEYS